VEHKSSKSKKTAPARPAEQAIRQAISMIPRGKVATYGQVAAVAGYPRGHRQVAQVLRKIGGSLPWYRVLGAGGQLKTTRESALEQRMRLEMEGVAFRGSRVDMAKHQSALHAGNFVGRAKRTLRA
jgi:methylated-DNA-protein-cysteine methyltransferase related protein